MVEMKSLITLTLYSCLPFLGCLGRSVLAILFNCSEPEAITKALSKITNDEALLKALTEHGIVLGAYAHTLTPIDPNWTLAESEAPQPMRDDLNEPSVYWKDHVEGWIQNHNVKVIGGCCGITPEHIRYIAEQLQQTSTITTSSTTSVK